MNVISDNKVKALINVLKDLVDEQYRGIYSLLPNRGHIAHQHQNILDIPSRYNYIENGESTMRR